MVVISNCIQSLIQIPIITNAKFPGLALDTISGISSNPFSFSFSKDLLDTISQYRVTNINLKKKNGEALDFVVDIEIGQLIESNNEFNQDTMRLIEQGVIQYFETHNELGILNSLDESEIESIKIYYVIDDTNKFEISIKDNLFHVKMQLNTEILEYDCEFFMDEDGIKITYSNFNDNPNQSGSLTIKDDCIELFFNENGQIIHIKDDYENSEQFQYFKDSIAEITVVSKDMTIYRDFSQNYLDETEQNEIRNDFNEILVKLEDFLVDKKKVPKYEVLSRLLRDHENENPLIIFSLNVKIKIQEESDIDNWEDEFLQSLDEIEREKVEFDVTFWKF